ncbi:MAG TPA: hypothetical protein VKR52_16915 [Terracidiphilus sp.]|nr:hypothetical protein [Terracidiphilus sp.]
MIKAIAVVLLFAGTIPALAARDVSVAKLQSELSGMERKPDKEIARRLEGMTLSERLSTARLAQLQQSLPGPESRAALLALADASAFLRLPESEEVEKAAPDAEAQRAMLQSAGNYVSQTLSKLPNFFATQKVLHFEDAPAFQRQGYYFPKEPLQAVSDAKGVVLYRDRKQVVDWNGAKSAKDAPPIVGLITSGEFGPILGTVLADAAQGKIEWSHWDHGNPNDIAVFRYEVPKEKSHYEVKFCCIESDVANVFQQFSSYHGEIALDPATGTILRITMQADLKPPKPVSTSSLMVEYGTVDIGGKSYICPRRSVAEVRAYQQTAPKSPEEPPNGLGLHSVDISSGGSGFLQTLLNDVSYEDYHLFRSESRVITTEDSGSRKN